MSERPVRTAPSALVRYAAFHRDRRNIVMHCAGIPLVVFALGVLLARPSAGGISLAWIAWALTTGWYLTRGHLGLGVAVSAVNALLMAAAQPVAALSLAACLGWGVASFIAGWTAQMVGHWYEGRTPPLASDLAGLPAGPMFVVAEWLSIAGLGRGLMADLERRVGPTMLRDLAHPITR